MLSTMLYKLDTSVETISGTELEMTKRGMGAFSIRCAVSAAIKKSIPSVDLFSVYSTFAWVAFTLLCSFSTFFNYPLQIYPKMCIL